MIEIQLVRGFSQGDDAILAIMDGDGLDMLRCALLKAGRGPVGNEFILRYGNKTHRVSISNGPARIEPEGGQVTWVLSHTKLEEITNKLRAMTEAAIPCHNYVDIDQPVGTLYLSVDEYVNEGGAVRNIQAGIGKQPS